MASDNAANIVACLNSLFKTPLFKHVIHVRCLGHTLNLIVTVVLNLKKPKKNQGALSQPLHSNNDSQDIESEPEKTDIEDFVELKLKFSDNEHTYVKIMQDIIKKSKKL